jgi:hypothetical protein
MALLLFSGYWVQLEELPNTNGVQLDYLLYNKKYIPGIEWLNFSRPGIGHGFTARWYGMLLTASITIHVHIIAPLFLTSS